MKNKIEVLVQGLKERVFSFSINFTLRLLHVANTVLGKHINISCLPGVCAVERMCHKTSEVIFTVNKSPSFIYGKDISNMPRINEIVLPEFKILGLKSVTINPSTNDYYDQSRKTYYLDQIEKDSALYPRNNVFIYGYGEKYCLLKGSRKIKKIDYPSILLTCSQIENYYHFMLELIARFYYLELLPKAFIKGRVIIIDNRAERNDNLKFLLELFANRLNLSIRYLSKNFNWTCKDVIHMETPNYYKRQPFDKKTGKENFIINYRFDSIQYISDVIVNCVPDKNQNRFTDVYEGIFIKRGNKRRKYNEEEISNTLKSENFRDIHPENFSVLEQAILFRNAKTIVSASGAALTNIIFCREGTKIISWLPQSFVNFDCYSSLAKYFGCSIEYVYYENNMMGTPALREDYEVESTDILNYL